MFFGARERNAIVGMPAMRRHRHGRRARDLETMVSARRIHTYYRQVESAHSRQECSEAMQQNQRINWLELAEQWQGQQIMIRIHHNRLTRFPTRRGNVE
jgi:hypothetical protein